MTGRPVVVLVSGGLDSTTVLAMARHEGREVVALSFRYGQRHIDEIESAKNVARHYGVRRHLIVDVDMRQIGGSALTADIDVPHPASREAIGESIPITYVPARNTIFLSYALAVAEVEGADEIRIGVNALDYSGYPDCRPEFIDAFNDLARHATKVGVEGSAPRVVAPLLTMTKKDIVEAGIAIGVDYSLTLSCYDPKDGRACGACDACVLRAEGFAAAGVSDPAREEQTATP